MKKFLLVSAIISPFIFISSCMNVCRETGHDTKNNPQINSEPQIQINQSIITAEIEDIYLNNEYDFIIKAKILEVEENPAYSSMAVKGNVYNLIPNFKLNENQIIEKESVKNKNLSKLSKLQRGDEFKAVIFFEKLKGWYVKEAL